MEARALAHRIPSDLGIHVGVHVDEPGRDRMALSIDRAVDPAAREIAGRLADLGNHAVGNEHVGLTRLGARAVDQTPA